MRWILLFGVTVLAPMPTTAEAQRPPDVVLEWTVQQKEMGKLAPGYHIYKLTCVKGLCTFYVVSLNQCDEGEDAAFYPRVEYWDNIPDESGASLFQVFFPSAGNVGLSLKTWQFGDVEFKMNLRYRKDSGNSLEGVVTAFTGGAVKDSRIRGQVITWELVPLRSQIGHVRVPLSCRVLLPTVVE